MDSFSYLLAVFDLHIADVQALRAELERQRSSLPFRSSYDFQVRQIGDLANAKIEKLTTKIDGLTKLKTQLVDSHCSGEIAEALAERTLRRLSRIGNRDLK